MNDWLRQNRGFLLFLLCFGFFRTAIADWNPIPSGSMRPTLLEGDVVLVDRLAYDFKLPLSDVAIAQLGDPRRGDVVTFTSPKDGMRLIKRVVALPGDRVGMRDGVLFVNGEAARYEHPRRIREPGHESLLGAVRAVEHLADSAHEVQYLDGFAARRNFPATVVPPGHYFMMGDNRDNSADSRVFGPVPRALLIGRAHHVLVSADMLGNWMPRLDRFGHALD